MKQILAALLGLFVACTACTPPPAHGPETRVLFVGNSLVYVGNVPAVYAALATANGHPTRADMIVRGGATLSQRVADGSVERALSRGGYDVLVLQERGGDLICGFGPDACEPSRQALARLAALAGRHDVRVVLLGTYQPLPRASRALVDAESAAATASGMAYAEVSETLAALRQRCPDCRWFDADGMHPGPDLALLNAVQLYRTLHGEAPALAPLVVTAPIYAPRSGLDETLRPADAPPPLPGTAPEARYSGETLEILLSEPLPGSADGAPP